MTKEEAWELAIKAFELTTKASGEFCKLQGASITVPQSRKIRDALVEELEIRHKQC